MKGNMNLAGDVEIMKWVYFAPLGLTSALSLYLPLVPSAAKPLSRLLPDWEEGPAVAEPVSHAKPFWQEGVQFLSSVLYPAPGFQALA